MLEMHKGLLTLVKEFDAICRKHQITYYLEGGSLLGAVRHKGFLPWDDDVDLSITRDEFKKLLAVIDQELPVNRELYCYERFPNYLRDTVKYTNLDTTVLFYNHILDGNAAGQHIDLFILDPVPSDPKKQEEYKRLATVYSELMTPVYVLCDDIVEYRKDYEFYRQMMEEKGREVVLSELREKLFTYPDGEDCDTYLLRWGNRHIFYPKSFFGEPVYLDFEDFRLPAPRQYYRFLRKQFGDSWMIVPDQEHQEDHNTFDKYHIPCKTFIADYTPFLNFDELRGYYERRKEYNIKVKGQKKRISKDNAEMACVMHHVALHKILMENQAAVQEMLENGRYAELVAYFSPYYEAQLSTVLLDNKKALKICDENLKAAVLALIMVGRIGQAEKLLRIQEKTASWGQELLAMITDIRSCMIAKEEARYNDAKNLALKWIESYPDQLNLAEFLMRQSIREGQTCDKVMAEAVKQLSNYPDSDELMYLMGDLLCMMGDYNQAEQWYSKCAAITQNGLIRMALEERMGGENLEKKSV